MSIQLINKYYSEIEKLRKFRGSSNESVLRGAFQKLLNEYAQQHNLKAEGPDDSGKIQYVQIRRLQGKGHRPYRTGLHRQCRDDENNR